MKADSKLFDRIRIKPPRRKQEPEQGTRSCSWPGCRDSGHYPAPVGRHAGNMYRWFCLEHVREYNRNYNYFTGMSDEEIAAYQKAALTGLRPTWMMGSRSGESFRAFDPMDLAMDIPGTPWSRDDQYRSPMRRRPLRPLERRALEILDLEETATFSEIRARYKELVKRHHPDANGGKKDATDLLIRVIQAYDCLKSAGIFQMETETQSGNS